MSWAIVDSKWQRVKGSLRSRWGKLTHDDAQIIAGQRDVLVGRLQERYALPRDEAERRVDDWLGQS